MDIQEELTRWGVEIHEVRENTLIIRCPYPEHEDENPSGVVTSSDGEDGAGSYYCFVCNRGCSFNHLLSMHTGIPVETFKAGFGKTKTVNAKQIEKWHGALLLAGQMTAASQQLKRELHNRGVSDETIRKYFIGFDRDTRTITIPIQWGGSFINVRKYAPGKRKKGQPKFQNYAKGYGKFQVLYPQDQLLYKDILVCGGEVKALAAAQRLNEHGIGAVSTTTGESNWTNQLATWLSGKEAVWVCMDVDAVGEQAAEGICSMIHPHANWVGNLKLPLDKGLFPKGDINDYFGLEYTAEDLLELMKRTPKWEPLDNYGAIENKASKAVSLSKLSGFSQSFNFETSAFISGVDDSVAHKLPSQMTVTCTNDSEVCSLCKLQQTPGYNPVKGLTATLDGRNPSILQMIGVDQVKQTDGWKRFFGIPRKCGRFKFKPSEELLTIRYVLLSDVDSDTDAPLSANVITDGGDLHYGEVCTLQGRVDQSPLTTEEVRLVTQHQPKDVLSEYRVDDFNNLERFRSAELTKESVDLKLSSIHKDLEKNVTFIYDRRAMHLMFDIAFHSPLYIPFKNSLEPGWVSALIVSETAQGKSTVMRRLLDHYGYGAYIDAANSTIAGLIGGVKTVGKRQFLKWGMLPQNDKKLLCIEEYANAPVDLLRAMRAARDSGLVKLVKIDKGAARARTRTIVLSNPKRVMPPGICIDGLTLLEELVERPEDLRRFDIGMWVPRLEVDEEADHIAHSPTYSSEACHQLITWAWTIPPDRIELPESTMESIADLSSDMIKKFPYLYLIGGREFPVKLARLAAAVAARLFSEENGGLTIYPCHVEWTVDFLRNLYEASEFGYSSRILNEADRDEACNEDAIYSVFLEASTPMVLADYCHRYTRYSVDDLKAAVGDVYTFESVYRKLLIMGCLVPEREDKWNNYYFPTKRFKKLLPRLKELFATYDDKPGGYM